VLDHLEYDDGESPAIGIVPPEVSWDDIRDHIKISHAPLLIPGEDDGFTGAYWASARMVLTDPLGSDQDEAVSEFRLLLHERGEA
jgi:hypothetical protein